MALLSVDWLGGHLLVGKELDTFLACFCLTLVKSGVVEYMRP